jgi:hypothetical protein
MGTDSGHLSWDINIPNDPGIQGAYVQVAQLPNYSYPLATADLLTTPEERQGIVALPAGYYLMQLWVHNGYQRIGHTEVVAIYSNMETTANYTFTGGDFVPAVKMSGTVTLSNTSDVQRITITARNNDAYIQRTDVMLDSEDNSCSWEMYTAAGSASSKISFDIEVEYSDYSSITMPTGRTITLGSGDVPDIDLGTVNVDRIAIGGSIHFTGIEQEPSYINISGNSLNVRKDSQVTLGPVSPTGEAGGAWSMKVPANWAGSRVEFDLSIDVGDSYFSRSLGFITIPGSDDPNISFPPVDLVPVTWSGTIDLTVNGAFPSGFVDIDAFDTADWSIIGWAR